MERREAAQRWVSRWINTLRDGARDEPSRAALVEACAHARVPAPRDDEPLPTWAKRVPPPLRGGMRWGGMTDEARRPSRGDGPARAKGGD